MPTLSRVVYRILPIPGLYQGVGIFAYMFFFFFLHVAKGKDVEKIRV